MARPPVGRLIWFPETGGPRPTTHRPLARRVRVTRVARLMTLRQRIENEAAAPTAASRVIWRCFYWPTRIT